MILIFDFLIHLYCIMYISLPSPAEEVRLFALNTVFKLCKSSGILLKPHITDIISILLESLSSLEPQAINYLSFHTESTQQLDNLRLSATKSSPIIEAVENCIEQIDDDVMKTLAPEICTLIKKSVGFPSKVIFYLKKKSFKIDINNFIFIFFT